MYRYADYIQQMLKKLVAFTISITVLLFFLGYERFVLGWLVGSGLNVVYFLMLCSRTVQSLNLPPEKVVAFIQAGALIRMLVIIAALVVILQFPIIHFGAAVAGVLSFKIYIYGEAIVKSVCSKLERR